MIKKLRNIAMLAIFSATFFSCGNDDSDPVTPTPDPPIGMDDDYIPIPESPVVYDPDAFPFATLSEYNFFEGDMKEQAPVLGVIPYEPISSLFTDYAKKKRFIWMPNDVQASYVADMELIDLPVGTILIKTFYYNNVLPNNDTRIIETRLMLKKADDWYFADYIWNDEQTEATFSLDGSFTNIEFMEAGEMKSANYRIPSEVECFTCHKSGTNSVPIGLKPQNLNSMYDFADGTENQLLKFINEGYLEDNLPATINTVVKWSDETQAIDLRVRSYIDINCAHCHQAGSHCDYRPIRLAFHESGEANNLGICIDPDESIEEMTGIVTPGDKETSVLYFRINTEAEESRMPLLGRSIIHEEAVQMIGQWIDELESECDD